MTFVLDVVVGPMFACFVFYDSLLTVGLEEGVHSFGLIVVAGFPLTLDVVVFQIMNGVVVVIFGWCLIRKRTEQFCLDERIWKLPGSQDILRGGVLLLERILSLRQLRLEGLLPKNEGRSARGRKRWFYLRLNRSCFCICCIGVCLPNENLS